MNGALCKQIFCWHPNASFYTQLTAKPLRIFLIFFCLCCCCTSYSRTFECYIQMAPVHQRMVLIFESLEISATWISNIPALFINFSINPFHMRLRFYGVVRKSPAKLKNRRIFNLGKGFIYFRLLMKTTFLENIPI